MLLPGWLAKNLTPCINPLRLNHYLQQPLHFCLLIPCYNDKAGLVQALQSVDYPFKHCLAVVVDDGSTQPLVAGNIQEKVGTGLQVLVIRLSQNKGITAALNTGLDWIVANTTAPYIARLDCADKCHPQRFYQQVAFLNNHPQVGLLGTWCQFATEDKSLVYNYITPVAHEAIKKEMHRRNVFIHPTVMFRTALVAAGERYPYSFPHAEDYGFFWRLLQLTEGAVLAQYLVTCAIIRSGLSSRNRWKQLQSRKRVVQAFGQKGWITWQGLAKLNLLMLVPKAVLLRLKGLTNKHS